MAELTQAIFEQIVREETTDIYRLQNVTVQGWVVIFEVQARRTAWEARVEFDPDTAHATIVSMYAGAGVPRTVADRVQAGIRAVLETP
ncbi:hypothetical protein F1C15_15770 (plasmid) [Frigoribacterium sp. NBH87]|uniref:hypothetical protein n=1 Tax=Frigoribacterium sp. NBH87 TaxID=2596916 RepID=UPI00162A570C|nr:hypothetical protein [Frigoribacterium sp. NBH87]QNE45428.1 hypothetical protein F1C15_15770 [Frigoribacterium sp. NBH87]